MAQKVPKMSKSRADRGARRFIEFVDHGVSDLDDASASLRAMDDWRETHAYPLSLVTPGLRNWVAQESQGGEAVVAQRLKRMPQIVRKLRRFPTMRLTQMEDIGGCRAVLSTQAEVEGVAKRVRRRWDVRDENDYRGEGKPGTGYRALHLIVLRRDRLIEIQLRTPGQHSWAEAVERVASRTGYDLKDGQGPADLLEYYRLASDYIWLTETGQEAAGVFDEIQNLRPRVLPYWN
jgi:putative GTP pyrophosphokinase